MYVSLSLVLLGMGQGGYWAIVTPLLFKHLEQMDQGEIDLDQLQPSKTLTLVFASKVLSIYAMLDALMVTLYLLFFIALHPDFSESSLYYSFGIVLFSYLVTAWTFVFPQYCLSRFIRRAKATTLQRIQGATERIYKDFENLDNTGLERLSNLISLYEKVNKTPNTVLDFSSVRSFSGSVIIPTVVVVLGNINWIFTK